MRYMLDTNICIYIIKHKPEKVFQKLLEFDPEDICISVITYAELLHGVEKSMARDRNMIALTLFLSNIEIIDYNQKAAMEYGLLKASLEKTGKPIGPFDMLIASHAKSLGYTLVTNNTKEFERVEGLSLENWI